MIFGVCLKDNKAEQLFRKDQRFCQRCGEKLHVVEISTDVQGKLQFKELE